MHFAKPLMVVVAGALLGGCSLLANTPLSGLAEKIPGADSMLTQKVTEAMFADIADPLVRKNMVAMANQAKVRVKVMMGTGANAIVSVSETEMGGTNYASYSYQEKNGEKSNEMIMMGDTTYLKDYSDNTWWKQVSKPVEAGEYEESLDMTFSPEEYQEELQKSNASTFTSMGEEACPNVPALTCHKYSETYAEGESRTFWFDTKDFLTRHDQSGTGQTATVMDYSYDSIRVTAPSPTKDVPEGKSIFEMMSGVDMSEYFPAGESMPSMEELQQQYGEYMPDNAPWEDYGAEGEYTE